MRLGSPPDNPALRQHDRVYQESLRFPFHLLVVERHGADMISPILSLYRDMAECVRRESVYIAAHGPMGSKLIQKWAEAPATRNHSRSLLASSITNLSQRSD